MCMTACYLIPAWNVFNMKNSNRTQELQDRVRAAASDGQRLHIIGGNSKAFYGNPVQQHNTTIIETRIHQGVTSYEPSELVLTARAGTPLAEIEALLAENGQMLPFEPPHYAEHATFGGAIAAGLSGSRRPFSGAVRDFVLGCRIINGKGEIMQFGGEVMKNVAGYDVSRLMAAAMGTLGLLLEVSVKVLPLPQAESTQVLASDRQQALKKMQQLNQGTLPVSAMLYENEKLYVRLSGAQSAVTAAEKKLGGEPLLHANNFWQQVNNQQHPFFQTNKPLWRLSVPFTAEPGIEEVHLVDWAGAQYWFHSQRPADEIRSLAQQNNGHATLFRDPANHYPGEERFTALQARIKQLHIQLKMRFDPQGIFNYGRLYTWL